MFLRFRLRLSIRREIFLFTCIPLSKKLLHPHTLKANLEVIKSERIRGLNLSSYLIINKKWNLAPSISSYVLALKLALMDGLANMRKLACGDEVCYLGHLPISLYERWPRPHV